MLLIVNTVKRNYIKMKEYIDKKIMVSGCSV